MCTDRQALTLCTVLHMSEPLFVYMHKFYGTLLTCHQNTFSLLQRGWTQAPEESLERENTAN